MTSETMTGMLLPTLLDEKAALCVKVTLAVSALTKPTKVPELALAELKPSYTLLAIVTPLIVNAFGVMLAVKPVG